MIRKAMDSLSTEYESLLQFATRIISEPYEDLWLYVHYERYFLQVRFLYYSEANGWVDSTSLSGDAYYQDLIMLHACAALMQKDEHQSSIITIHSTQGSVTYSFNEADDKWNDVYNLSDDISLSDRDSFCKTYNEWKNKITCSGL
jgi:hypothetical protein